MLALALVYLVAAVLGTCRGKAATSAPTKDRSDLQVWLFRDGGD